MDNLVLCPEILTHPNIPKPLHGLSPRTIMGQEAWDVERQKVYAQSYYRCVACGVHKSEAKGPKWLEAHEFYDIDYRTGRVEIKKIVALCHYCHNFIHSGRLYMIQGKEKGVEEIKAILEHGFLVLADKGLECFYFTFDYALELGVDTHGVFPNEDTNEITVPWGDWRLIYNGKEYLPLYENYQAWRDHYAGLSKKGA